MVRSFAPDSTPIHSSLERSKLGRFPSFRQFELLEGVVLKARFKDDPENLSKQWTEYDVMEVSTRQIYPRCRVGSLVGGIDNFDEVVLAETTGTTDGSKLVIDSSPVGSSSAATESFKLNGERVAFSCFGGEYSSPLILVILPHPDSAWSASRQESPRRKHRFNGWTQEIDKAGNLSSKHDDGRQFSLRSDGSAELRAKNGAHLTISVGGTIALVQASGETLLLGATDADQSALRGPPTVDALKEIAIGLGSIAASLFMTELVTKMAELAANLTPASSLLSPKVKVP